MIKVSISGTGDLEGFATELKQTYQDREAAGEVVIAIRKERVKKASTEADVPLPIEPQ